MNVIIAEEALQKGDGHWPSYIGGMAKYLRTTGHDVEILAHSEASAELLSSLDAQPWFRRNCWREASSQGVVGGLRHNLSHYADLRRWFHSCRESPEWLWSLTTRSQHLLAYGLLVRLGLLPRKTRCLLLFVQGFGTYDPDSNTLFFPQTAGIRFARFCFRLLKPAVLSGRVVIAAETAKMREELAAFTDLPVQLLPHPVEWMTEEEEGNNTRPANVGKVSIAAPGFARHEKGSDLLQSALLLLLADPAMDCLHFSLQWRDAFELPDGSSCTPSSSLIDHPRVTLENRTLSSEQYRAFLRECDLVILPYRQSSYRSRVSRVAIEAAGLGIPLIYSKGTWSEELAELAGRGSLIAAETPDAIAEAIRSSLSDREELASKSQAGKVRVRKFHSTAQFIDVLSMSSVGGPMEMNEHQRS